MELRVRLTRFLEWVPYQTDHHLFRCVPGERWRLAGPPEHRRQLDDRAGHASGADAEHGSVESRRFPSLSSWRLPVREQEGLAMPSPRHFGRSRPAAGRPDIGLWHLSAALVLVGGALGATIGPPALPWTVVVSLERFLQTGLPAPSELARLVAQGISGSAPGSTAVSNVPTIIDLELFLRSPSTTQVDAVAIMFNWITWLLWLWLLATTVLRIVVVLGDRAAAGARWPARLRAVSDRITLSLVRQAVDATLASEMFLRAVAPSPAPV